MYVCNCHIPIQTELKITNRQNTCQSFFFNYQSPRVQHNKMLKTSYTVYLTKVILNKNNFLFLKLQFMLTKTKNPDNIEEKRFS